ncbi:MAG: nucleotidyltransferase family protein [Candidatus Acidiferrum sp.]
MNEHVPVRDTDFDGERLLALSSLLRKSSREIETCVRGGSMGSALPEGSRIRIRFRAADNFVPGQIVSYIAKDRLVVHRLVRSATSNDNHYLITRGDTTVCCDAPVLATSVMGIVTESQNSGRWQPVGPPVTRARGSRLLASAICGMVVTLLRLNPAFSYWFAARMIEIRRVGLRFVGLAKRYALRHRSAGGQQYVYEPMRIDQAATSRDSNPQASTSATCETFREQVSAHIPEEGISHPWVGAACLAPPSGLPSEHPVAKHSCDFSAEREFLLQLLGQRDSPQDEVLRWQAAQIDWVRLLTIIPPDLYAYVGYKLARLGLEGQCPTSLWEQTLNHRRLTAVQWLRHRFELHHLVEAFSKHNVDFLLLKGPVLAFAAYPHHSLRPMSDIDLLVRPEDLDKALELTFAAGFRCPERYKFANPVGLAEPARSRRTSQFENSLPLQKPGTGSNIEVHTQLEMAAPWFPVNTARVWEGAEEIEVDGLRVHTLEKHEFLFHLVMHLARHHIFELGLRPLLDVHLWVALHRDRLDWDWIASETIRRGYGDWVHLTLKIVCDSFHTPIPLSFFDRVPPPPEFERLQHLAYEQIWAERRVGHRVPTLLALALSQPSARRAVLLILRRVLPNRQGSNLATVPSLETLRGGGLILSLRRAVNDIRVKLPMYFRAWRNGSLSWRNLQRATRLAKGSLEIEQILINRVRV